MYVCIYIFLPYFLFWIGSRAVGDPEREGHGAKSDSLVFIYIFMIFNGLHTQ
jgi:hypothetical protein